MQTGINILYEKNIVVSRKKKGDKKPGRPPQLDSSDMLELLRKYKHRILQENGKVISKSHDL